MPTRHTAFLPLVEVGSSFLNGQQDITLDQRATGPANSMSVGLDTASPGNNARSLIFAAVGLYAPPATGLLDNVIDWRDRQITIELGFDPNIDIRWGRSSDDKIPEYEWNVSWYSLLGGRTQALDPKLAVGMYVSLVTGGLYLLLQRPGYVRGRIKASVQTKERLP